MTLAWELRRHDRCLSRSHPSDLRSLQAQNGTMGVLHPTGDNETCSRSPKDQGEALRYAPASAAVSQSYDSLAKGGLYHTHRQGCVANVTGKINRYRKRCHSTSAMFTVRQMVGAVLPKSDTVRWELPYCQRIHVTLMFDMKGASRYESEHDTIHPVQRFG